MPKNWGTGGLLSPGAVHEEDIAEIFADLAAGLGVRISVRPHFAQAAAWERACPPSFTVVPHLVHVLDLDGGFDRVWRERFAGTARTAVRKAERSGLTVETDTTGRLIPQFYDLYLRWHERRARERRIPLVLARRIAQHREPLRKFTLVAERLQNACRVWVARHEGEPVAAIIALVAGEHAYYWRGYSERDAVTRTRANDLLQRLAIEDACLAGCRTYNMGQSGGVRSLMDFKQKLGARPVQTPEFRLERLPFNRSAGWHGRSPETSASVR